MTMPEPLHVLEDDVLDMTLLGDMHDRLDHQLRGCMCMACSDG